MIRSDSADSIALELKFGIDDDEPVLIELEGGRLRLRGAIDRVDQDLHGLHVIDYKTGRTEGYGADVFAGGRRLQHAIYARVAEERLGVEVADGQYHFPTRKGQNQKFVYDRDQMSRLEDLLELLLDGVVKGHFVPTDDPKDCTFCDFSDICRARRDEYWKVTSPLADWAKAHTGDVVSPVFEQFQRVRSFEE
jgi:RecB family exonuclease